MSSFAFGDRNYELIRASDVGRDGLGLELWNVTGGARDQVFEAFYFDADRSTTFTAYREDLPLDLVEWFAGKARELLPPIEEGRRGPKSSARPTA
jgi:hypothetical protein